MPVVLLTTAAAFPQIVVAKARAVEPQPGLRAVFRSASAGALIQNARLIIRIKPMFRGKPLRQDDLSLTTPAGDRISISRLAFLVSNIAVHRPEASSVVVAAGAAYVNPAEGRDAVTVGGVPIGDYSGLSFVIGLDAKTNHSNPTRFGPMHPLNPQACRLHWNWSGGYVFLAVEGGYRAPDGKNRGYSYHLGKDGNRVRVTVNGPLRIAGDTEATVELDAAMLFDGISPSPVNGADSTHSAPGDALAAKLKQNITTAFALRECRPLPTAGIRASSAHRAKPGLRGSAQVSAGPPAGAQAYRFVVPDGFPQPNLPADNPLTIQGIALGRKLFLDDRLSGNGRLSCAGCHRPDASFSDRGQARSLGIDHRAGARRTMPLFNLAWSAPYTWDGGRARLRDQAIAPIINAREMHADMRSVIARLGSEPTYRAMFRAAFGSSAVTPDRMGRALEQHLLTLISADSKFDRAARGEAVFTDQEKRGLMLFVTEYDPARGRIGADCFHCHGGNLFSDYRFTNNGIDEHFADRGRSLVTHRAADDGKFKTPSLRNVAITGPYMHDGRFKTLEEVVDHYTHGIHRTPSLDPNIAKHPDSGMDLTAEDKASLVAFLRTLTDEQYSRRLH